MADEGLRKNLGITDITDQTTREQVGGYVEKEIPADQRAALESLKKDEAALVVLRNKMAELRKKNDTQATEYVAAIIGALQEQERSTAIEETYIRAFLEAVGTKGIDAQGNNDKGYSIDWEVKEDGTSPVLSYCLDHLRAVAKTVPANVVPKWRDAYVRDYIAAYAKEINNCDWLGETFDMEEKDKPANQLKENSPSLVDFETWLKAAPRSKKLTDPEILVAVSGPDTDKLVDVDKRLKTARETVGTLDDTTKATLTGKLDAIAALPLTKADEKQTQMTALEKEITEAVAAKKTADEAAAAAPNTPTTPETPVATPETKAEDQGILDMILSSSKEAKNYLVGIFKNLPQGVGTVVVELLGFLGFSKATIATLKAEITPTAAAAENSVLEKVATFFTTKLKIASDKVAALYGSLKDVQVSQFLQKKPDGLDKKTYDQMVVLLPKAGAKNAAVGTKVIDFINQHADDLAKIDSAT